MDPRSPAFVPIARSIVSPAKLFFRKAHFEPSIGVVQDTAKGVSGPLWVKGGIEVQGADGAAYETRNRVALCRCGTSGKKPFCDGSHVSSGLKDSN